MELRRWRQSNDDDPVDCAHLRSGRTYAVTLSVTDALELTSAPATLTVRVETPGGGGGGGGGGGTSTGQTTTGAQRRRRRWSDGGSGGAGVCSATSSA